MRNEIYNHLLSRIPSPENVPCFNTSGKLIICLVEYRIMPEVEWVINAALRVYKPCDIGFSIVYGKKNAQFIEERYSDWKNIILINTGHENLDRGTYSGLLKMHNFYKPYENWSHVLIYQTDALLIQKMNDVYFQYDYVGAPWKPDNQCAKYNAGNGGFSLRNVKSCLRVCEPSKDIPHDKMHRGNEDIFFCEQDSFKYIPVNTDLHYKFSIERVKFKRPLGCHQINRCWEMNNTEYMDFIMFASERLIYNVPLTTEEIIEDSELFKSFHGKFLDNKNLQKLPDAPRPNTQISVSPPPIQNNQNNQNNIVMTKQGPTLKENIIKPLDGETKTVKEMLNVMQKMGSFSALYLNEIRNKWSINCDCDYEIMFCKGPDPSTCVESHTIDKKCQAALHKLEKGCMYKEDDTYGYLIFYPGFPDGGKSFSDIHAPWGTNFNKNRALPKNGAIILKSHKHLTPEQMKQIEAEKEQKKKEVENQKLMKLESCGLNNIKENILFYDLFTGVGYYNQLFSLEHAIYLANISKRHLFLNMKHPLVACGRPDSTLGPITNYITDEYKQYLPYGLTILEPSKNIDIDVNELTIPSKISSVVIVDEELDTKENADDIKEFLHWRIKQNGKDFYGILNNANNKVVSFKRSNASRCFSNYYTTQDNYKIMSNIALALSKYHPLVEEVYKEIYPTLHEKYISLHFRFGDWHKSASAISNGTEQLEENISKWLEKHNTEKLPLYLMVDRKDHPVIETLKNNYTVVLIDELIKNNHTEKFKTTFKNTTIIEFLLQKKICENAVDFIGSQGSTVSVHIQYMNYIQNKDYHKYGLVKSTAFNNETLSYNINNNKTYSWCKKNYMGGHPVSWSMFFEDNISK